MSTAVIRIPAGVRQKRDELVEKGICLMCEKPLAKIPGNPTRGCCARCYQAFVRAKERKTTDEKRLIKEGRILTAAKRGRKPISPQVKDILEGN